MGPPRLGPPRLGPPRLGPPRLGPHESKTGDCPLGPRPARGLSESAVTARDTPPARLRHPLSLSLTWSLNSSSISCCCFSAAAAAVLLLYLVLELVEHLLRDGHPLRLARRPAAGPGHAVADGLRNGHARHLGDEEGGGTRREGVTRKEREETQLRARDSDRGCRARAARPGIGSCRARASTGGNRRESTGFRQRLPGPCINWWSTVGRPLGDASVGDACLLLLLMQATWRCFRAGPSVLLGRPRGPLWRSIAAQDLQHCSSIAALRIAALQQHCSSIAALRLAAARTSLWRKRSEPPLPLGPRCGGSRRCARRRAGTAPAAPARAAAAPPCRQGSAASRPSRRRAAS
jgi:hypothetical protein